MENPEENNPEPPNPVIPRCGSCIYFQSHPGGPTGGPDGHCHYDPPRVHPGYTRVEAYCRHHRDRALGWPRNSEPMTDRVDIRDLASIPDSRTGGRVLGVRHALPEFNSPDPDPAFPEFEVGDLVTWGNRDGVFRIGELLGEHAALIVSEGSQSRPVQHAMLRDLRKSPVGSGVRFPLGARVTPEIMDGPYTVIGHTRTRHGYIAILTHPDFPDQPRYCLEQNLGEWSPDIVRREELDGAELVERPPLTDNAGITTDPYRGKQVFHHETGCDKCGLPVLGIPTPEEALTPEQYAALPEVTKEKYRARRCFCGYCWSLLFSDDTATEPTGFFQNS